MDLNSLEALSPLDGRYNSQLKNMANLFSEFSLIKHRVHIEAAWLSFLIKTGVITEDLPSHLKQENKAVLDLLEKMVLHFSLNDAQIIKNFESTTAHDLKAVEYFIKQKLQEAGFAHYQEFVHFGCTSEDINNLSYALMLQEGCHYLLRSLHCLNQKLQTLASSLARQPMLSRTHGQAATPTTLGKEIANYCARLSRQLRQLEQQEFLGKFGGAVGNFNAHHVAYPEANWPDLAESFVCSLGLTYNPMTTQIEPHDFIAEIAHKLSRINTILIDFNRNTWTYISLGYFSQKTQEGEIGSSTMPHKINPIHFENSEGNLGLSNALLMHLAEKLPISRLQRDLTDSTVLRNLGVALGHADLAYQAIEKGLSKLQVNPVRLLEDLENNPSVLTEAIQTMMRRYGQTGAYELLKDFSRGKEITKQDLNHLIKSLDIPSEAKKRLLDLSPENYLGFARELTQGKYRN